jgi:hypothetical protein
MIASHEPIIMTGAIRLRPSGAIWLPAICLLAACGGDPQQTPSSSTARQAAALETASAPAPAPDAGEAARLAADTRSSASDRGDAPRPAYREVNIPSGALLPIVLDTAIASDTSSVEDAVRAHLARAVSVRGTEVLPAGTDIDGVVVAAERPGKVRGRARVAFRLTSLHLDDERVGVRTSVVWRRAPATKKQDAAKIGIPAAGGAVVGAIVGGKKGAAIGGAAGGGAGTAVVLSTRGREVRLPAGSAFTVRLLEPVTVRVPVG